MGGLVHFVKAFGFEEKVANLASGHRNQPCNQGRHHGIDEQVNIGHQKGNGTDQMQGLVDAAVVVIAVVVPALRLKGLQKLTHEISCE